MKKSREDLYPPNNLRKLRVAAGLSQGQLAAMAGIAALQTVSKLERRVMGLTDTYLEAFSRALNVTKGEILIDPEGISPLITVDPGPYNPPAGSMERLQELLGFWRGLSEGEQEDILRMFHAWIRNIIKRRLIP